MNENDDYEVLTLKGSFLLTILSGNKPIHMYSRQRNKYRFKSKTDIIIYDGKVREAVKNKIMTRGSKYRADYYLIVSRVRSWRKNGSRRVYSES